MKFWADEISLWLTGISSSNHHDLRYGKRQKDRETAIGAERVYLMRGG